MKILYLQCQMGAAGDMLLSALYELLEDKAGFLAALNRLGLPGVSYEATSASSGGISGTRMRVTVHGAEEDDHAAHPHSHTHATLPEIDALLDRLPLPQSPKAHAKAIYNSIAHAEAAVHGCPVELVHFHEVGALDAVADIVGVCYALDLLAPDRVEASAIHVGSGTVHCAHGVLPVPAPATARLLSGIPIYGGEIQGELCTPTGAALLAHFVQHFGPLPPMTLRATGCGIGSREFSRPNCLQSFWGEADDLSHSMLTELVCNLDDMTPEALAFACTELMSAGALDAYTVPGTMKKGRSGHVLTVLCQPEDHTRLAAQILRLTTTNGVRVRQCEKITLAVSSRTVQTPYGAVRIKTAQGDGILRSKPEYDDVACLARENGLPYDTVAQATRDAAGKEAPQ